MNKKNLCEQKNCNFSITIGIIKNVKLQNGKEDLEKFIWNVVFQNVCRILLQIWKKGISFGAL